MRRSTPLWCAISTGHPQQLMMLMPHSHVASVVRYLGLPMTVKEQFMIADLPTIWGSQAHVAERTLRDGQAAVPEYLPVALQIAFSAA